MKLPPEIRKRLQELNRGPLTFKEAPPSPPPAHPQGWGGEQKDADPSSPSPSLGRGQGLGSNAAPSGSVELNAVAPGEVVASPFGNLYLIRKTAMAMLPHASKLLDDYDAIFRGGSMSWRESSLNRELRPLLDIDPERVLFLDIETTGLSAQPLFLIGVMHYGDGDLQVRQILARDYSEERAALAKLEEMISHYEALVTFNGKSFDVPYIRERGIANGVVLEFNGQHVDLLHEARRRWRGRLPNCKLQTLERYLLKRVRSGDIPGELIPQAYHNFVLTGNAFQMADILHHNALDLIAMSELLVIMIKTNDECGMMNDE